MAYMHEVQLYVTLPQKDFYFNNKKTIFDYMLNCMQDLFSGKKLKKRKKIINNLETSLDDFLEDLNTSTKTDRPVRRFLIDIFNRYINALSLMNLDALAISIASGRFNNEIKYTESKLKYTNPSELHCHVHTDKPTIIKDFCNLIGSIDEKKSFIGLLEGTEQEKEKNLFYNF